MVILGVSICSGLLPRLAPSSLEKVLRLSEGSWRWSSRFPGGEERVQRHSVKATSTLGPDNISQKL